MARNWIAVASADHVQGGQRDGFMQVCHGKAAPLRRLQGGDRIVYYSPSQVFGSKIKLQAFTALGIILPRATYQVAMGEGFHPYRRDVLWLPSQIAAIHPLLESMEFSAGVRNWAYQFRFGIVEISSHDMDIIAAAMQVDMDVDVTKNLSVNK
ncbi:EVE domain-containing protein [Undibacterium sp. Di26W]|uniref:EVE domain-containing protein n=1 Tax=Undibacterium sp. Di26W TaxID=3413035 RepID=UPI003BF0A1E1